MSESIPALELERYRTAVELDAPVDIAPDSDWRSSVGDVLTAVAPELADDAVDPVDALSRLRHALAPVDAFTLPDELVTRIEAINVAVAAERGVIRVADLPTFADDPTLGPAAADHPHAEEMSLVVADITRLDADAIVNAANRWMLGCRVPGHACIDNAIHSAAGPRLRDDCQRIMTIQGELEPVGDAKLTRAHALPSRHVLHTVGPQLQPGTSPTPTEIDQLASAYRRCLDLAAEVDTIRTVAFCGISTGVFAFPADRAARIALDTITDGLDRHPGRFDRIVIDCFTDRDADHYRRLLT